MLSGKREISKAQAKKLGEYFNVSPAAFIWCEYYRDLLLILAIKNSRQCWEKFIPV
jgi:hypothetical protein